MWQPKKIVYPSIYFHYVNENHVNKFYKLMDDQNLEDHDYKLEVRHLLGCEKTCDLRTLGLTLTYPEARTLFFVKQKKTSSLCPRTFSK